MIYQIKITLQHTKPSIWRRILVHKDMTLVDLHETIQIVFDWMDMHLHCFEARKTNGMSLTERHISIGTNDEEFIDMIEYDFDENKEKLSSWLVREKDKLMYVYDFGDDWRHEIVLEKILVPEAGLSYPYCVKAMRGPAEEDCGGFVDDAEDINADQLQQMINMNLEEIAEQVHEVSREKRHAIEHGQWGELFSLAKQLNDLAPWTWLDNDQIFAVQNPKTGEYAYCSVMGALGEEFGLAAFIGGEGLHYLKGLLANHEMDHIDIFDNRSMVLSFCNRDELSPDDYDLIKREGFSFRGKKKWPMFRSLEPGYYPWPLSDEEVESFTVILNQAIDVCTRTMNGFMIEEFQPEGDCFAISAIKQKGKIDWKDTYISNIINESEAKVSELLVNELDLQRLKSQRKRFNVPIEVGIFYAPTPVQEHPNEKPYFPLAFVAAERKNGMIVFHDMFPSEQEDAQLSFIKLIEQLGAIPREIWLNRKLFLVLEPVLEKLNISTLQVENLPIIEEIKESMYEFQGGI